MEKKKKDHLLQTTRQICIFSGISGGGFLLYLAARGLRWYLAADIIAGVFALVAGWAFFSASALRNENKEAVSYNLLWGTGALMIMLGAFAVLGIRARLGF